MADLGGWSLTDEQRAETVRRVAENLASMAFTSGVEMSDSGAQELAVTLEKKAYNVARVESTTTTGVRPASESLKSYTRNLANRMLDSLKRDGGVQQARSAEDSTELNLFGDREFLTAETATEALGPMLAPGSAITKIKLSTKSFGRDAAEVAAAGVRNCAASLAHADLSDVIAGRPEAEALDALRIMCDALAHVQLRSLDLSDNALGEKGVRACAAALTSQAALESVTFHNVGCSVHACQAIGELLTRAQDLRSLALLNNMSDDEGAVAIAQILGRAPLMEHFRMVSCRVGATGGIALAQGLSIGSNLVSLDLSDNPLTGEVSEALAHALRGQDGLRVLNLNDTSLGDEGIRSVAEALPAGVEDLGLALNEVSSEGAADLAPALRGLRRLRRLSLRENELGNEGAASIASALAATSTLEMLDLTQNQMGRVGAVAVAKAVKVSRGLQRLELDDNQISEDGVEHLRDVLRKAGQLGALGSLEDNCPDDDEEVAEGGEDGEEDEDADEEDVKDDGAADDLASAMAQKVHIS